MELKCNAVLLCTCGLQVMTNPGNGATRFVMPTLTKTNTFIRGTCYRVVHFYVLYTHKKILGTLCFSHLVTQPTASTDVRHTTILVLQHVSVCVYTHW